mgnify:CR=1 FL=1
MQKAKLIGGALLFQTLLWAWCTSSQEIHLAPGEVLARPAIQARLSEWQTLLSNKRLVPEDWGIWEDAERARYVAGILSSMGYKTLLVHNDEGAGGGLVLLCANSSLFWVPIIPCHGTTKGCKVLGYIPISEEGKIDSFFANWTEVQAPSDNKPPVPVVWTPPRRIFPGESVRFMATGSYDPDGKVVVFLWDFSDGSEASGIVVAHVFKRAGDYWVALTIVDDRGSMATKRVHVSVEENECGCKNP